MKFTLKIWVLVFGMMILTNVAYAETPREQLKQLVEQLRFNMDYASDASLREKIIKLARTIKPAPTIPEEAEKYEGRAQFAFKSAKSPADYLAAAKEYEVAIAVAPWVAGYYSDLCTIYERAEVYDKAKRNCQFFLISSPSAQEASDTRKRIAGLDFAIEKANSPEVRAAQEKEKQDAFFRSLDGAKFVWYNWVDGQFKFDEIAEIHGKALIIKTRLLWADPANLRGWAQGPEYRAYRQPYRIGDEIEQDDRYQWENGQFFYRNKVASISPNGQSLTIEGMRYQRQ
jgi:hypothetical protein